MYCPGSFYKRGFANYQDHAKVLVVFKDDAIVQSYANHVARIIDPHFAEQSRQAQLEIIFQLKIIRD